jgi:two-component system, NtrC family, response regulator
MLRVCRTIERVATSDATVLLLGESGTGKEVLAQGCTRPASAAALRGHQLRGHPENLLESELFGYEKGAFTGAAKTTVGKIETAHGGTLMLDEIGDLPHSLQAKLLRFLQERKIERVGGRQEIPVDVRVVCATHQDLKAQIKRGPLPRGPVLPAGRDRGQHPAAARAPGRRRAAGACLPAPLRAGAAPHLAELQRRRVRAIENHAWPGNVRELLNVVKRATIMADGQRIGCDDLGLPAPGAGAETADNADLDLRMVREKAERRPSWPRWHGPTATSSRPRRCWA